MKTETVLQQMVASLIKYRTCMQCTAEMIVSKPRWMEPPKGSITVSPNSNICMRCYMEDLRKAADSVPEATQIKTQRKEKYESKRS